MSVYKVEDGRVKKEQEELKWVKKS
jgi:hypothetical protein